MIGQRNCPYCKSPALHGCEHLALAVEGRDFVRRCVELSESRPQWQSLCQSRRARLLRSGEWSPEREDFTWLETAFRDEFLKRLAWFGEMDYEWRSGPRPEQGGFWVLIWSKDPRRLWWELHQEIEQQAARLSQPWVQIRPPLVTSELRGAKPPPRTAGRTPRFRFGPQG
jgi:hypothetical protein